MGVCFLLRVSKQQHVLFQQFNEVDKAFPLSASGGSKGEAKGRDLVLLLFTLSCHKFDSKIS